MSELLFAGAGVYAYSLPYLTDVCKRQLHRCDQNGHLEAQHAGHAARRAVCWQRIGDWRISPVQDRCAPTMLWHGF